MSYVPGKNQGFPWIKQYNLYLDKFDKHKTSLYIFKITEACFKTMFCSMFWVAPAGWREDGLFVKQA